MCEKQYFLVLMLAVFAGVVGGLISTQISHRHLAFAEKTPQSNKIVEAEQIRLVDTTGRILAWLGEYEEKVSLILYDKSMKKRISLSTSTKDAGIQILGEDQKSGVGIASLANGPFMGFHSVNGKLLMTFQTAGDTVVMGLHDRNDKTRATFGVNQMGAALSIYNETEKAIWVAP
jgi:hypothetical protein